MHLACWLGLALPLTLSSPEGGAAQLCGQQIGDPQAMMAAEGGPRSPVLLVRLQAGPQRGQVAFEGYGSGSVLGPSL